MTEEELYEGIPTENAKKIRSEAIERYGEERVFNSEHYLKKLSKEQLNLLIEEQKSITKNLFDLSAKDPESIEVQLEIARHYQNTRKFWGTDGSPDSQSKAYNGLGELYCTDDRFNKIDGQVHPEFAQFRSKAMAYFAKTQLD